MHLGLCLLLIGLVTKQAVGSVIATANCNFNRKSYNAELQLFYSYIVEFDLGSEVSLGGKHDRCTELVGPFLPPHLERTFFTLLGMETAIALAVAQELDACDDMDRPLFKVRDDTEHVLSRNANCTSVVSDSSCHVVTGVTVILLDFYSAQAREEAYAAIRKALGNSAVLQLFASSVVRTQFLQPLSEALVAAGDDGNGGGDGTATVAVATAAAVVAFILASVICYGLMYDKNQRKSRFRDRKASSRIQSIREKQAMSTRKDSSKVQQKFARLGDGTSSSDRIMVCSSFVESQNYIPSTTWSLSDITSDDSGSIRSNISRTTSKLESIDEGVEDEETHDRHHHVRSKRRRVKDFDCGKVRRGTVYISNLSQCRKALLMPSDSDLKIGTAKCVDPGEMDRETNIPQSIGSNRSDPLDSYHVLPNDEKSMSDKRFVMNLPSANGFVDIEQGSVSEHLDQINPNTPVSQKCKTNETLEETLCSTPSQITPNQTKAGAGTMVSSSDDGTIAVPWNGKLSTLEDVEVSSIDTSAGKAISENQNEENLAVDGDVEVDALQMGCTKALGEANSAVKLHEESEGAIRTIAPKGDAHLPNMIPGSQARKASDSDEEVSNDDMGDEDSSGEKEEEGNLDGSRSLYSLEMDDTINTFVDDATVVASSPCMGDNILVQLDCSGTCNESNLDDVQVSDSDDDSFFVDDVSEASIDDSGRTTTGSYSFEEKIVESKILTDSTNQAVNAISGTADYKKAPVASETDGLPENV
eukprot:scaffold9948_cov129-Cylindrotheca_fusiformis.AAC.11